MRRFGRFHLCVILGGALASPSLSSQEPTTLKVETHLISTTFTVHDAKGNVVSNLQQEQFTIKEDGAQQKVRYFARERELPLSIGLIVDVSGSQDKFVKEHEKEIEAFLKEVVEPRDEAFTVCFGNHLRLVNDWTSSPNLILDNLRRFRKGDRDFPEIGPKEDRDLGTALYDAVYFSIMEKLAAQHNRRKVLLIFSDGEENSSEYDLLDAIGAAQNNDVLVYAIRTTNASAHRMNARNRYGMRALDHLAESTGGRTFDARTTNVRADFVAIAEELRALFEIGYYSNNRNIDGKFRKVEIGTNEENLTVRARGGYYAR